MNPTFTPDFNCPFCQQPHHVFDTERTEIYVCGNCNAVLKAGYNAILNDYALHKPKGSATLHVGSHGVLRGINYKVIAVAERFEVNTAYYWFEYTLMQDKGHELAFLSSYEGHWNLLKPVSDSTLVISPYQPDLTWESKRFVRFSRYRAQYNYASGEFHWYTNLRKGVDCAEFICPPYLLAVEIEQSEKDIFIGEYISPEEISKAFLDAAPMPKPIGIAPAQPSKIKINPNRFLKGTLVFTVLVLMIQWFYVHNRKQLLLFNKRMYMDTANINKPGVSPSFKLEGSTSNMEIELKTDLNNSWCEMEVNLVNEQTGKETAFVVGAEHYSGVSEGESWSEGSRVQKEFVCSVQPGTYHFVTTFNKSENTPPVNIGINVWWDVPTWWNAIIVSLIMLAVAMLILLNERMFEAKRWEGSNLWDGNNLNNHSNDED
jgi:transcription initiation factor TFIIIB Brf1 subunit/transcription initiation factor TFIIB